jgi:aspartokinase
MIGNIPTEIRSTFDGQQPATLLDNDVSKAEGRQGRIIALSIMHDVAIHHVYEPGMAEATGRLAQFEAALADANIPLIDSRGDGVDGQKYFVASGHSETALRLLQANTSHGGVETKEPVDLITMVGYNLQSRFIDNVMDLVFNGSLNAKRWQGQRQDLSPGRHSLRLSVDPTASARVFDRLHEHFLER